MGGRVVAVTVPEIRRLLAALLTRAWPPGHAEHWLDWRRRHKVRSRWCHQRTRLAQDAEIALVRSQMAAVLDRPLGDADAAGLAAGVAGGEECSGTGEQVQQSDGGCERCQP